MEKLIQKYKDAGILGTFLFGAGLGTIISILMVLLVYLLLSPIMKVISIILAGITFIFAIYLGISLVIAEHKENTQNFNKVMRDIRRYGR